MPAMHGGRQDDLQAAEAEHQAAHRLQAFVGQLQADQEQQEDDAEFGDAGDVLGVDDGDPVQKRQRVPISEPSPSGPSSAPAAR